MNETRRQLVWLRRGLTTFVGLLSIAITSGLISALLATLGDSIGTRAFQIATLVSGIAGGVCGVALLAGSVWSLIQLLEQRDTESR